MKMNSDIMKRAETIAEQLNIDSLKKLKKEGDEELEFIKNTFKSFDNILIHNIRLKVRIN